MKVIFLDFDGVLNNMSSLYLRTLNYDKTNPGTFSVAAPNPVCVGLIEHLLRLSGAKLVISSSWRGGYELKELAWCLFSEFGMKGVYTEKGSNVVGKTRHTDYNDSRGQQIQDYLDQHSEITEYVIIDDDSDMLESQKEHFVKTDPEVGFSGQNLDQCLEILKIPKEQWR